MIMPLVSKIKCWAGLHNTQLYAIVGKSHDGFTVESRCEHCKKVMWRQFVRQHTDIRYE